MVIERSRAWVKARIPAFICRETNWWVSRWIQTNVFLCPHCRQEYRSLKKVWECLDEWEEDQPGPECELEFSNKFREQFPSAFRGEEEENKSVLHPWYGKVGLVGGTLAVGLACMFVIQNVNNESTQGVSNKQEVVKEMRESDPPTNRLAAADEGDITEPSPVLEDVPDTVENDLFPPAEPTTPMRSYVRNVSFGNLPASRNATRASGRHVVEINNHRVVNGFGALALSTDNDAY